MNQTYFLGIDVGSTTAKLVLAHSRDDGTADVEQVIYETYERHFSRVREKILDLIDDYVDLIEFSSTTHHLTD